MGIYKKGDNWFIDYYLRGKRKRKKVGPSKKLAEQVLKDKQVKIAKGEFLGIHDEKKVLFKEFANEYLTFSKANKSATTYRRDQVSLLQLRAAFTNYYLSEITPQLIEKHKAARLVHVQPATVNREIACLKHMYNKAMEWDYTKHNPVKGVKLLKEPPGRLRYLEPVEIEALINVCAEHLQPIVITAINTGMRKSEILYLKWANVDLQNRKVIITKSKNNEMRVIPMNDTLYNVLASLKEKNQGDYVFSDSTGHPYGDIKKGFTAAVRRAGIQNFRFHDLRHTFGSHLVMKGVDLRTVQQMLGHKDIKMTMRYSHLSPAHVQEAVNKLDSIWTYFGHQANIKKMTNSAIDVKSIVRP